MRVAARISRLVVAARYRCFAQSDASNTLVTISSHRLRCPHQARPRSNSGCPRGERPYGSGGAQKGVPPQAPGSRAATRVLQPRNHGWERVMSTTLGRPLAALCHPSICRKSHRSPPAHSLPFVHPTLALQLEDLRVETFDVTLPPRASSGPLNAETEK